MSVFQGTDYDAPRDQERLSSQHLRVKVAALSWPGGWFTMGELAVDTGEPAASVERQVRYLRSPRFGGWTVQKRHRSAGTFEYRIRGQGQGELFS